MIKYNYKNSDNQNRESLEDYYNKKMNRNWEEMELDLDTCHNIMRSMCKVITDLELEIEEMKKGKR